MKRTRLLPFLDPETATQVETACATYRGQSDMISSALGALMFGQLYGYRGVCMAHTRQAVRRYEALLGIKFREHMPERTELSERILGIRAADEIGKFWAVVKGEIAVQAKRWVDDVGQGDLFQGRGAAKTG